ncbi:L-threonylcarbamoyladenylate synthase [Bacteriovoracaceae bacterium]|nr:L-threonylcarbamoyladenylate synthase [Bacteriovoracaceae bacterium]
MISYVFEHSIDQRVLDSACNLLKKGCLLCFPTDTSWIIVCDPTIKEAITKFYSLKSEDKTKHYSLLCNSISMASEVAFVDDKHFKVIKKNIPGHFTFILEAQKSVRKYIKASKTDREIGLRFPPGLIVTKLIESYEKPLISTNLTHELLKLEKDQLIYPLLIEDCLGHLISMIIDPGEVNFVGPSTIVSLMGQIPEILRQGAGQLK